ncbi:RHS repeat-associated core domain-containing protein [Kitasatospora aureofaciens]|uniref:RHS repeat-associated core domain-containing protein n=1 Tax=Kitasatospora aureofaciens TaxID=1894 RepID=UPI0033EDCB42
MIGSYTVLFTDPTSTNGTPQSRTTYDPYGRASTTNLTSGAPTVPFGFTGQYNEPGLNGKQYLRAREYDPSLGRFTARDPLATSPGSPSPSAYTYAAGAPTIYTDPTGMSPEDDDPDNPENMSPLGAIGSGLLKGVKSFYNGFNDVYNALAGNNGGIGAFIDKYIPIRPAYAMYVAEAKLREFGCNNMADYARDHADELVQQLALSGLGGLSRWLGKVPKGKFGTLREPGAVSRLLYGARRGEGLPGSAGFELPGRPSIQELENLTLKHGVEFAVIYKLGPGPKGAGGTYYLYSGWRSKVGVPVRGDSVLVYHTHPDGAKSPSDADRDLVQKFMDAGSPMRSSKIIPLGEEGRVYQFNTEGIVMNPGGRTWDVVGTPRNG